jgi:hypothetical protein
MGPVGQWLGKSLTGGAQVSAGKEEADVPLRERAPGGPWAGCWPGPECCPAAFLGFSFFPFPFFSDLL